ncbi:InlB B-repeat-containing protein [Bifidobacterium sp. W8115]|uniref:RCC1 domain-containing protein n=1 Tax=Bifidobacterium TaxID=1678 RepID=UPI0018DD45A9|nr:InlB B-repeat-containing protein [Bifidobacterium sp. W8112]MBI0123960.1 InlB B-repeat-containing protein [Bifidobacterium apousia]
MRFDPADGSKPTQSTVKTGTLATPPQQNPQRQGFRFDGWTLDGQPFDFQIPILRDTTLEAKWTKVTDWRLSPDHGPASGALLTINPPSPQEPYYTSIQAKDEQILGLTGDGRIYTWTQDSTPVQVPFPVQAPAGFHYQQVATGSRWHAALGSDQHIYTWSNGQTTPTILDNSQNTKFTSISMNGNRLLAVDRQGQIHTVKNSQNQTSKLPEQATLGLPEQAQTVTAVASDTRILALDSDGQAWTRDTGKTASVKPARIKQDPRIRIIQAQALNMGFLLLDVEGQAYYLADSTTNPTALRLPDDAQASRITANGSKTIITGKDGHLWAWEPDDTPASACKGQHAYTQAAAANGRITAISGQGILYQWSLDKQDQPARLNTTQAALLKSASVDSQTLTLSRNNNSWQVEIPASKPGQAAITITGEQDGKPFTRSLKYTVDQTLTRDAESETSHTVDFNTGEGGPTPDPQQVPYPYGRAKRPSPNPVREGYLFDGWFIGEVAYDFSKPVTGNLTLTAKWTRQDPNNTWSISPDKGSQLGKQTTAITPPATRSGIRFSQVSGSTETPSFSLAVGSDGNAYAWGYNQYGQLGNGTTGGYQTTPIMVRTPDRKTYPDLPEDFTYVQVSAGNAHSLAVGSDGYVYAWGFNNYGQLGNNTSGTYSYSSVPVRVSDPANPTDTSKGLKAIQVSGGYSHSLAVGSDGYVYAWGLNNYGQLGNNTSDTYSYSSVPVRVRDPANSTDTSKGLKAIQVSAGSWHSLAVGSDGYTYAWGLNEDGQLGNNKSRNSSVPVRVCDPANPTDTSKGLQTVQVSGGGDHSLAVDKDGQTWSWGRNDHGELGNGTTTSTRSANPIPARVRYPANARAVAATQVSAGTFHSLAVDKDGNIWAWGYNYFGQLGNNTTSNRPIPVKVFASAQSTSSAGPWLKAAQISAGGYHSLVIGADGYAKAWGRNGYGQLGNDSIPTGEYNSNARSSVPVPVMFNLQPVITGVRFDQTAVPGLTRGDGNSVTVLTPAHQPGTVTVSVDYTLGGAAQTPDTSLRYTYLPAGVLPKAGGEGILLALATGMTGMGGVLASRRHRTETHQLSHASHE